MAGPSALSGTCVTRILYINAALAFAINYLIYYSSIGFRYWKASQNHRMMTKRPVDLESNTSLPPCMAWLLLTSLSQFPYRTAATYALWSGAAATPRFCLDTELLALGWASACMIRGFVHNQDTIICQSCWKRGRATIGNSGRINGLV